MRRLKLKTMLLLFIPLAIGLCFVDVNTGGDWRYGHVEFSPGLTWWWNSVSPSGEATGFTGFAVTRGWKRLFSIEEWNGGIFINFNYDPMDPAYMRSGYWLRRPPSYPTPKPWPVPGLPVEFLLDGPPLPIEVPEGPPPPEHPEAPPPPDLP